MNYFEINAISNSLLNKVDTFVKYGISKEYWNDKLPSIEGEFIEIGTAVDELISNELDLNTVVEEYDLTGFSTTEKKILQESLQEPLIDVYLRYYDNKDTKDYIAGKSDKIMSKVDDLYIRARGYYDFMELNRDRRIVSKEVYETINKCYQAILQNKEYQEIFSQGIKQLEIYWKEDDLDCKAKIDLVFIDDINQIVYIADLKTHATSLVSSIKKRNYIRQLSFYSHSLRQHLGVNYEFKYYIIGCHTKYYKTETIEISERDIEKAMVGGYLKPDIFTIGKNFYLDESQINMMVYNGFWDLDNLDEKRTYGWSELIKIYNENYR